MNIIISLISFMLFIAFLAFILYFGVIFIAIALISFGVLWLYIVLRSYWLSFRYGNKPLKPQETNIPESSIHKTTTTIIDAEYHEISEKNSPPN